MERAAPAVSVAAPASGPIAPGDVVVIEWRTSGTRAADGVTFSRRGCAVAEVRGGKIAAYRDYFDRQTLTEQLSPSP